MNDNLYTTEYTVANWPKPMGYWILDAGSGGYHTKFAQYKKPHRIQIWFTEKLLGWKWEDAT